MKLNYSNFSPIPLDVAALDIWHKKPFDKAHALIDIMIISNNFDDDKGHLKGRVYRSKAWFAKRWGWDVETVTRFLNYLEENEVILINANKNANKKTWLLTLINKGKTPNRANKNAMIFTDENAIHSRYIKEDGGDEPNGSLPPEEWEDLL